MELQLPNSIISPEDLKEAINDIRRYGQWFSQYQRKQAVTGSAEGEPPQLAAAAVELINRQNDKQQLDQKILDKLIHDLEDYARKAPRVVITLAGPPPGDLKKALVKWCRQNISEKVLTEFKFSSNLLGGMVVQFGSHIYDWSFRRQILANSDKFPEILRNA